MRLRVDPIRVMKKGQKLWCYEKGKKFAASFLKKRCPKTVLLAIDRGEKYPESLPWSLRTNSPVDDEGPLANRKYRLEYRD